MIVVIPSMSRASTMTTHKLMPYAIVVAPESQRAECEAVHDKVVLHPDAVYGLGAKRQWMLEHFDDELLFFIDDDIDLFWYQGGNARQGGDYEKINDPQHIWEVLLNTGNIARDIGTTCWGFAELRDYRKFSYMSPFSPRVRINGFAMGIVKKGLTHGFDRRLVVKSDFDFYLMTLFWQRYVWCDSRYSFTAKHYTNPGGLTPLRSISVENECTSLLARKFGTDVVRQDGERPWTMSIVKDKAKNANGSKGSRKGGRSARA